MASSTTGCLALGVKRLSLRRLLTSRHTSLCSLVEYIYVRMWRRDGRNKRVLKYVQMRFRLSEGKGRKLVLTSVNTASLPNFLRDASKYQPLASSFADNLRNSEKDLRDTGASFSICFRFPFLSHTSAFLHFLHNLDFPRIKLLDCTVLHSPQVPVNQNA